MKNKADFGSFLDILKQKCEIVSTISGYITLTHKGNSFWACCPFHGEKLPSFSVKQDGQFYHCFGCGETGDVIKFVQKYENVDFMTAVSILAKKAGLELPSVSGNEDLKKKKQLRDKMLEILKDTAEFYISNWQKPNSEQHKKYVLSRNFTKTVMNAFKIGASLDYFSLPQFLFKKGHSKDDILSSGVAALTKENSLIDSMGTRLVFPIMNGFGDVVGFTGRDITNTKQAKYKNTSQTVLFNKSQLIYGLHNIREFKKANKLNYVVVVEGNIDVIACYGAGFENTVACMGTALTASHARELHRLCDDIILCLDSDNAGRTATYKAIEILRAEGLKVNVAILNEAKDPDEYIKKFGKEAFSKVLKKTVNSIDFILDDIKQKYDLTKNEQRNDYINETLSIIKNLATPAEQEIYLNVVRDVVRLPIDILKKSFNQSNDKPIVQTQIETDGEQNKQQNAILSAQIFMLASIIFNKKYILNLNEYDNFFDGELKKVFEYLKKRKNENKDCNVTSLFNEFDIEKDSLLNQVIGYEFIGSDENQVVYYNDCVNSLKVHCLQRLRDDISKLLSNVNTDELKYDLIVKLKDIDEQIKRIKK